MQIHEITKLSKKRTDEGLLDSFKQAAGLPVVGQMPQRKDKRTVLQKLAGAPQDAPTDAEDAEYRKELEDHQKRLEQYWAKKGYKTGDEAIKATDPVNQAIQQVQGDQTAQKQIQGLTKDFDDTFKPGIPDAGTVFTLTKKVGTNDVTFTKDDKGVWRNEGGGIIKPQDATGLEQQLDAGGARQVSAPTQVTPATEKGKKPQPQTTQSNKPVAESFLSEGRKSLSQGAFEQFVSNYVKGTDASGDQVTFTEVLENDAIRRRLTNIFKQMYAALSPKDGDTVDIPTVKSKFKDYMTVALAGLKIAKQSGRDRSEDEIEPVETGDPLADQLSQEITQQGLDMLEKDPQKGIAALQKIINVKKRGGR